MSHVDKMHMSQPACESLVWSQMAIQRLLAQPGALERMFPNGAAPEAEGAASSQAEAAAAPMAGAEEVPPPGGEADENEAAGAPPPGGESDENDTARVQSDEELSQSRSDVDSDAASSSFDGACELCGDPGAETSWGQCLCPDHYESQVPDRA